MSNKSKPTVATMGIDIGKNAFHVVGLDQRRAIVLRQKWSRGQEESRGARTCALPHRHGGVRWRASPQHSPGLPCWQAWGWRCASIAHTIMVGVKSNPQSARCQPVPTFRRFGPWRFSDAGRLSAS